MVIAVYAVVLGGGAGGMVFAVVSGGGTGGTGGMVMGSPPNTGAKPAHHEGEREGGSQGRPREGGQNKRGGG